jgi:chromosome segregation ATPase
MPYYFYEEELEGYDPADVVERSEYDAVIKERDEVRAQRDTAISRAEAAEAGWEEAKEKYANAFLTTPSRVKQELEKHVKEDGKPKTYAELFGMREGM